jgi:hypothetical protein
MKKALICVGTALLLGVVTMVAPLMLFKPTYYNLITTGGGENATSYDRSSVMLAVDGQEFLEAPDGGAGTYDEGGALARAVSYSNLSSAGLILVPSFFVALVVSLYVRKKMS